MSQLLGKLEWCNGLCQQPEREPQVPGPVLQVPATGVADVKQMKVSASAPGTGKCCPQGLCASYWFRRWRGREAAGVLICISTGACNLLANFKLDEPGSRRSKVQAGILNRSTVHDDSQGIQGRGACEHMHVC